MPKSEPVDAPSAAPALPPTGTGVTTYSWGDSSGPWLIETQASWFDYARVPKGTLATKGLTLSGCAPTYNFQSTYLLVNYTATVRSMKSTDNYTTSSVQQNQKFQVNSASSDYLGTSYGDASNYTASTMGVRGNVYSSKKFYKRTLWDDTLHNTADNEYNENVVGANYVMASGPSNADVDTSGMQSDYLNDFPRCWVHNDLPGTLLADGGIESLRVKAFSNLYNMQGTYNPQSENLNELINTLDTLGNMTTNFQFASMPPTTGYCGGTSHWTGGAPINHANNIAWAPCWGTQTTGFIDGCKHYDVNRHDYS
tara:strand:- start:80 stop:1012 length:933 start_codon:yes stop_codon:yes gene_type:complete